MKNRSKAMLGLSAAVVSLSAVGFGFSKWGSELSVSGNVGANGSWDVAIKAAEIESISSATTVDATTTVTVYPVYVGRATYPGIGGVTEDWYRMKVDDLNPMTVDMSAEEFAEFDKNVSLPGVNNVYSFYTSGLAGCTMWFQMNLNEEAERLGFPPTSTTNVAINDDGASEGQLIGYAIPSSKGTGSNKWGFKLEYDKAAKDLAAKNKVNAHTQEVTVYPVYAGQLDYSGGNVYRWKIDDVNKFTKDITLDELNTYTRFVNIPGQNNIYSFYTSKKANGASMFFYMQLNDAAVKLGFDKTTTSEVANTDDGASDGVFLGYAIASSQGTGRDQWGIEFTYNAAKEALEASPSHTTYPASVAADGLSATFLDTNMTMPGAWAEYSVTIENNGTADANLKDYVFTVDADDVFSVDAPVLPSDEVLKPGESCEVTFVVSVDEDYDDPILEADGVISVSLSYAQSDVEPAPGASHNH